ncbi:MAG: dienelactone hydrolase family protein [Vulcanimicrobiaceae bacterium]
MTVENSSLIIEHNGSKMPAYLARPATGSGPHPAVIVLQEIFGVNKEVKRIADFLAGAGYVALAINYYHRTHPDLNLPYTDEGLKSGFAAAANVSKETLREDVAAAIAWLNGKDFVKSGKIATWGFCFGGAVAFVTATLPGLAGAVCFYGGSIAAPMPNGEPEGLADVRDIRVPLLLAFGGQDDYITPAHVERIRNELQNAGKDFQIEVYPTVGHAFFRESSAHLQSDVVADAWNVVQAFFARVFA